MKTITFKRPEGVTVPDGTEAGQSFRAMATLKLGAGGDVQLTEIDGEALDGAKDKEDDTTDPEGQDDAQDSAASNLQQKLQSMMSSGGQNQGQ